MEIKDHGNWEPYVPESYPIRLPPNVLYARRVEDGTDWYLFQRKELTGEETIKLTAFQEPDGDWIVQATATDASMLFPINMRLIEVVGATEFHETFRQKILNLDTLGRSTRSSGDAFTPARPTPVMRFEFLIALHKAGLLEKFQEFLQQADVPTRLALEAERSLEFNDRYLVAAARELGWGERKLRQLFESARE